MACEFEKQAPVSRIMAPRFAFILPVALALGSAAFASPFREAGDRLDGEWRGGEGFVLEVGSDRAQASLDPNRPFQWQRFIIKEVTEDEVVFTIGNELFQAKVEPEALRLSGTGFRGEKLLRRAADATLPDLETRGALP